jgi:hypothetical protein
MFLLDDDSSHPTESIKSIHNGLTVVKLLLPNVTSIIYNVEAHDQGAIASMKQHYWAEVPKTAADENDKLPIR